MSTISRPANVWTLKHALAAVERAAQTETNKGCALGSFAARYTPMIGAHLKAAQTLQSPVSIQISQREMNLYGSTPEEFAATFYEQIALQSITIPAVLHLDHTKEFSLIERAIEAGFTSVMIDASEEVLERNIAISREVVEYAHARGVSVEAELGRIGTTDYIETEHDDELYTIPEEAARFVHETNVDALAVSVGTAHGVYRVRQPKIDYARLSAIRALTPVHLVLHGGSGVPAEMIQKAAALPGGGISKVNISTDLEIAFLSALGRAETERLTNADAKALPPDQLAKALENVEKTVSDKMVTFLKSADLVSALLS